MTKLSVSLHISFLLILFCLGYNHKETITTIVIVSQKNFYKAEAATRIDEGDLFNINFSLFKKPF